MLQYKIPKSKTILHSIPIGSIMVLLLLLGFLISPNIYYSNNSVYAVEEDNASDNVNNNTSTHANDTDSSTSLIIGGAEMNEVVDASVGEVAYRKHTVTISASKLKSYTLFISGPEGLKGDTAITGANGNTPVDMPKNSWGYAYGQDGSENNMTYSSFTNNAELIDSKLESESTTEDTDFTKNLIFAVKFGNAIAGHYTGTVTLSLAAEPKEVVLPTNPVETWDELQSMQQMTSKACASIGTASVGNYPSKTLIDSRDGNEYTITKLDDQNCWMTTNLKLDISEANSLTSEDSNIANGTTWPSKDLDASGFSESKTEPTWNNGTGVTNSEQWKDEYGYYYNWCAATAGFGKYCESSNTQLDDSEYSICPRGWKLPTQTQYDNLIKQDGGWDNSQKGRIIGGGFFQAAGYIIPNSLYNAGTHGQYWSGTAYSSDYASRLQFDSSYVAISFAVLTRSYGYPVRCIAMNEEDEKKQEEAIKNTPVDNWNDVEYMQQMSARACASIGTASVGNYPSKTLIDSRDGNEYTITKLDDQNCWMTQNLRITGDSIKAKDPSNTTGTITSADSNVSSNYDIPASSSPWNSSIGNNTARVYYAGVENNGANYTWCAATVGCNSETYSICPRGWRLPSITEYETFLKDAKINFRDCESIANCTGSSAAEDSTKICGIPYNFHYAGYVDSDSLGRVDSEGRYWSSTASGSSSAYFLNFSSTNEGTFLGSGVSTNGSSRYGGYSVRCIAQ